MPRPVINFIVKVLAALRVIPPRGNQDRDAGDGKLKRFVRFNVPVNFVTAPLIADLFLLAILAIGRREVHDGTIGANNIAPIDIMVFFITLAYIAISIDASGLIRFLAFKVLQKGGKVGHRLFFYLYAFFFSLGTFVGNDPIILSGTAFLAYMTRVSSNIVHPRAWIYSQFAVANIASAILVSSNPTNLVLAGAFGIKFLEYTANMIVPVVVTAIVLFPFLLYIVFADEKLIPLSIKMHELSQEAKEKKPVNPNIPNARVSVEDEESNAGNDEQGKLLSLEEIMNPFLDKKGAGFGAVVMAATLITVLALNAASQSGSERPVFWVTLPAAFVMLCWDIAFGWYHRNETREIARKGRLEMENARAERTMREQQESKRSSAEQEVQGVTVPTVILTQSPRSLAQSKGYIDGSGSTHDMPVHIANALNNNDFDITEIRRTEGKLETAPDSRPTHTPSGSILGAPAQDLDEEKQSSPVRTSCKNSLRQQSNQPTTLVSLFADAYRWSQETFPTATAVMSHLPFALVPFSFCMFVLVQALVTKGWVAVFAHGWDAWVEKTGTVGSIGGMGFLSVILCNVSFLLEPTGRLPANGLPPVRWNEYRYHDPPLPRNPSMATNTPSRRNPH